MADPSGHSKGINGSGHERGLSVLHPARQEEALCLLFFLQQHELSEEFDGVVMNIARELITNPTKRSAAEKTVRNVFKIVLIIIQVHFSTPAFAFQIAR